MGRALNEGGEVITEAAKANGAPISTGVATQMRVKVTIKRDKVEVQVGSTSPLSHLFEYGTKAHPIGPREKRALLLDRSKFASRAQHPGTAAHHWLRPAFDSKKGEAQESIRRKLAEALRR